ncbi:UDP-glucose/GDP-mannose dehydrogenase family, NAD binding domain [Fibrobacter sp. UWT2]|nr:3-hydroxyacyl-CoA dehydrogenase NAD-binding domain-containing protein [Fibrobacter sp. UWT2]SHK85177.1 UDP-glucose/GDP-mannose dehydrogenase family, NAD binding domain [Fibrobacter sp. UWT2]
MNIAIVGTGYVGLVSGTCFAEMGVNVTCVDVNQAKVESLQKGEIPIYEPGLDEMVLRNQREGRLKFTTDLASVLDGVEMVFSAVGTPPPTKTAPPTCSTFSLSRAPLVKTSRNTRFS